MRRTTPTLSRNLNHSANPSRFDIRRRQKDDIAATENDIAMLAVLIQHMKRDQLAEAETSGTVKPLSPEQARKRAERDRNRQERIRTIQASAADRIARLRGDLGK